MPTPVSPPPDAAAPAFPLFLDLRGRTVLVLGGGSAAAAKARLLLRCGAEVRLVAPELAPEAADLERTAPALTWHTRAFAPTDLEGVTLAIDAAGDADQTAQIKAAARTRNILVNVVDTPAACDFTVPAIVDRAPVTVAIATGGAAPVLARTLRHRLEQALPPGIGRLARAAGACRERVKAALPDGEARKRFWESVLSDADMAVLSTKEIIAAIDRHLGEEQAQPRTTVTYVAVAPDTPNRVTLGDARMLAGADVLVHDAHICPAILDLARRDARRVPVSGMHAGMVARLLTAQAGTVVRLVDAATPTERERRHLARLGATPPPQAGRRICSTSRTQ